MAASDPSASTDQLHETSYLDFATDNTSHHALVDQQSSHPSVIVHAPPAVDQKPTMVDHSIIQSWESSHSLLESMDGSPDKLHSQMCGSAEDGGIGLGPASWASGGGTGTSGQLDLATSAAASWDIARPAAKRNRRTKHPVWELFRRTSSGQAQCQLCNAYVRSPCSSNFMGHLNRHHSEHYQDVYNRWLTGRRSCSVSESQVTSTTTPTGPGYSPQSNSGGTPSTPSGPTPVMSTGGLLAPSTSAYNEQPFTPYDYGSGVQYAASSSHYNMTVPPSLNCTLDNGHSVLGQSSAHPYNGQGVFHYTQPQQQLPIAIPEQSLVRPSIFVDHQLHAMHQPQSHHDVLPQMPHPDQYGYAPPHSGMGHPHEQR
ncbi:hypothetical protein PMAYCL1PPCAC_17351 [Pristionchus mayeri]|uniref:BED-type domain-containing protein n=1 Tax=Pristionchus mayeri TaxID=1317129 RepID=A0AAN5CMI5_9BILA|nr:hypothetical protein PMAYCL1PPCAC_17351 [Pristionchus mayeri]